MTPRQRRMTLVFGIIVGVGIAGALALSAFRQNVTFFFDPSQVAGGQVPAGERFRLGGMVTEGSVKRSPGSLEVRFVVTDFKHDVPVSYTGVLPDLFREGTGVVAHGRLRGDGTFVADEVLAKHDEKYMPPEVARSLKRRHGESRAESSQAPAAQPPTARGAAAQGAAAQGAAAQGPAVQGPAAQAPTPQAPTPQTPTAQAASAEAPAGQVPASHGAAAQVPALPTQSAPMQGTSAAPARTTPTAGT